MQLEKLTVGKRWAFFFHPKETTINHTTNETNKGVPIDYRVLEVRIDELNIEQKLKNKLKSFGFPLLIAYIFSVAQTIITKEYKTGFLHYLWFIHILLIYKGFALLLIKNVKKEKTIDIVMLISMCVGIGLRFIPSLREFTEVLCFIYIPLGYFIRKIKLPYKDNLVCFIISLLWLALSVYIFTINKTNLYLEFKLAFSELMLYTFFSTFIALSLLSKSFSSLNTTLYS